MTDESRRKLRFLAGFAAYFGALWLLWDTPLVYPLKVFVVLLHEVSHALAGVATGGTVERILLDPYQGGATLIRGGNAFAALSAGYLGSLAWGAMMVMGARARWLPPRAAIGAMGGIVIALTAVIVRSPFGVGFGILFGLCMIVSSRKLSAHLNRSLLLTLGLTSTLYAILDIKSDVLDRPELRSDAVMLGEITGISGPVWGVVWIVVAVAVTALLFRWAYKNA